MYIYTYVYIYMYIYICIFVCVDGRRLDGAALRLLACELGAQCAPDRRRALELLRNSRVRTHAGISGEREREREGGRKREREGGGGEEQTHTSLVTCSERFASLRLQQKCIVAGPKWADSTRAT